jgi:hypothetical protein
MTDNADMDIQDYLDATGDSAKRSRTVAILVVITCILVFTGLLNELKSNWLLSRIKGSQTPDSDYIQEKIGPPPVDWNTADPEKSALRYYDYRYKEFTAAMTRAYVDSALLLRIPFFGIIIDVNDLGLLGGISFIVLLVWYRFCLSREIDNLRLSFSEVAGGAGDFGDDHASHADDGQRARHQRRLREFYNLLAMRQVFTVPNTGHIKRTPLLQWTPKLICWLPVILHCSVTGYDLLNTPGIGNTLNPIRFGVLAITEVVFAVVLIFLAAMATRRLRLIDGIWDGQWRLVSSIRAAAGQ